MVYRKSNRIDSPVSANRGVNMANHVPLDNINHQDLRIITKRTAELGDAINCTNVFPFEFRQLQAEYPIFFKKSDETGQFSCVTLFGFEDNENLFLSEQGWQANYIPLSMKKQPFLIGFKESIENGVPQKTPTIHLDMSSARISKTEGEALFLAQGGKSPYLEYISSVLEKIYQGHGDSSAFSNTLVELDLIESLTLGLSLKDGVKNNITGLYSINEKRLKELSSDELKMLHTNGYLEHIYMMLGSLANLTAMTSMKNKRLV